MGIQHPSSSPRQELTLYDSTCIIVGIIVGVVIYQNSPMIAQRAPGVTWLVGLWLLGGALSVVGALCYAELANAYPKEGGDYVYLTRAFGRTVGFLFAWCQFWIVRPGSVGAMAYVFADYANRLWTGNDAPTSSHVSTACAVSVVLGLTAVNLLGVREGKWTQNVLTTAKILGLSAVVAVGFLVSAQREEKRTDIHRVETRTNPERTAPPNAAKPPPDGLRSGYEKTAAELLSELSFAMILVLYAYGGWHEMAYVAAEVKNPRKNILRAMLIGTAVVAVIYVLVNLAFVHAVGLDGARRSSVAADVLDLGLGRWAGWMLNGLIAVTALGAINGQIFTGARIFYAVGTEHRLYAWLGRWDARRDAPAPSLCIQSAVTVALIVGFGLRQGGKGFESMVLFTTPVFWFFLMLVGASVFVLRRRDPDVERPFRVPGYPLTPILFCLSSAYMAYAGTAWAWQNRSGEAFWSIGIFLAGILAVGVQNCFPNGRKR